MKVRLGGRELQEGWCSRRVQVRVVEGCHEREVEWKE